MITFTARMRAAHVVRKAASRIFDRWQFGFFEDEATNRRLFQLWLSHRAFADRLEQSACGD